VSNTALSLDGRIGTAKFDHVAIGSATDRRYMSVLRARADAVLVGGRTWRNWPLPLVPDPEAIARLQVEGFFDASAPDLVGRRWVNAIVSRGTGLPDGRADPRVDRVLLTGQRAPEEVIAALEARGVRSLLLECGGDLLAQFLQAGLVDEIYVTLCPLVLGGRGAPTLADGDGFTFATAPRLSLLHAVPVEGEVYCRYRVER
jgi:riboflavin biosynthesis pyrimidine reductase